MINIAVKNHSTVLHDNDVLAALPFFQCQVTRDFASVYGQNAKLSFLGKSAIVPSGFWLLVVLDDADQAGALGYHDLQSNDMPIGKVFAKTTKQYGGEWTVTLSHELLEMLADPFINMTAFEDNKDRIYAYEVCDAVEADELGYEITHGEAQSFMDPQVSFTMPTNVRVSDFVLPHWFDEHCRPHLVTSFKGNVKGPFQLAPGGYISFFDVRTGRWKQVNARAEPSQEKMSSMNGQEYLKYLAMKNHDAIPRPGSRRERRNRGKNNWIRGMVD